MCACACMYTRVRAHVVILRAFPLLQPTSHDLRGWAQRDKGGCSPAAATGALSVPDSLAVSVCAFTVCLKIGENTASSLAACLLQRSQKSGRSRLNSFISFLADAGREGSGGHANSGMESPS